MSQSVQSVSNPSAVIKSGLEVQIPNGTGSISSNVGLVGSLNSSMIGSLFGGDATGNDGLSIINGGSLTTINSMMNAPAAVSTANVINPVNAANAMNAAASNNLDGTWISDTELVTGNIPAALSSDEDFGIKPDVSTVIEMDESEDMTSARRGALYAPITHLWQMSPVTSIKQQRGMPLSGAVTRTANGARSMTLQKGSVVFAPACDTIVETPFGVVRIGAKSVVLMMSFRHGLAIFDLHDAKLKSVVVKAGNRELVLSPGMHALITSESVEKFEQVNPAQMIGHRNLKERALGQGLKAFVTEFSVLQALNSVTPLKQMVYSNRAAAQKVTGKMLKTAAILQQMSGGAAYEQVLRPTQTAYQALDDGTVFGAHR